MTGTATLRDGGCNHRWRRLQPYGEADLAQAEPKHFRGQSQDFTASIAIVTIAVVSIADLAQAEPDDLRGAVGRARLAGACEMMSHEVSRRCDTRCQGDVKEMSEAEGNVHAEVDEMSDAMSKRRPGQEEMGTRLGASLGWAG